MPIFKERESAPKVPDGVTERAEEVSAHIEKGGVTKSPTQFKAQVTDDSGKPLVQTQKTKKTKIEIPATKEKLESLSKGDTNKSITWFAVDWLRRIKKAFFKGVQIVLRQNR